jgi:formate dehydrogenase major subunit
MKLKTNSGRYARLKVPLIRTGGQLRPADWDEALDRAARGLRETVDRHGPHAVGMFSCSKSTNELNFVAQKFARVVLGSNNIDSCNRT